MWDARVSPPLAAPRSYDGRPNTRRHNMAFARSLVIGLVSLAAARKLPYHKETEKFHQGAPCPASAQP